MDQRSINLYDQFTHAALNRRDFIDRLDGLAALGRRPAQRGAVRRTNSRKPPSSQP